MLCGYLLKEISSEGNILPDEMGLNDFGGLTKETHEILDLIDKMDGKSLATAARSCRDLKLEYPDITDGVFLFA